MEVVMVGFAPLSAGQTKLDTKRWGYNSIAGVDRESSIVSVYGKSAHAVAVSPGDSGGPMFSDCKVIGVASRMVVFESESDSSSRKISLHTNITTQQNLSWLRTLQREEGAHICGLSGVDNSLCRSSRLLSKQETLAQGRQVEEIPCAVKI
jgi:hypothetical protein